MRRRPQRHAGRAVRALVGRHPSRDARNNELLLAQLADVPDERRGAYFACAVAFCHPDGTEAVVRGEMRGRVVREVRGSGGFGYDVLFEADEAPGVTTAELTPADKDAISHRGKALREIGPLIAAALTAQSSRDTRTCSAGGGTRTRTPEGTET